MFLLLCPRHVITLVDEVFLVVDCCFEQSNQSNRMNRMNQSNESNRNRKGFSFGLRSKRDRTQFSIRMHVSMTKSGKSRNSRVCDGGIFLSSYLCTIRRS
jgi:hypothetical protein